MFTNLLQRALSLGTGNVSPVEIHLTGPQVDNARSNFGTTRSKLRHICLVDGKTTGIRIRCRSKPKEILDTLCEVREVADWSHTPNSAFGEETWRNCALSLLDNPIIGWVNLVNTLVQDETSLTNN